MNVIKYSFSENRYRFKGYLSNVAAVSLACAMLVFVVLTSRASLRSIQIITKNMGQNVILLHDSTRLDDFYASVGRQQLFPEKYIDTLFRIEKLSTTYHVGILQHRAKVRGVEAILTGANPVQGSLVVSDHSNPFLQIPRGTVRLGGEIAKATGLKIGDSLDVLGAPYTVSRVEEDKGLTDDWKVYMPLHDLQAMLKLPGQINAIISLECLCNGEPLSQTEKRIRNMIENRMPDMRVYTLNTIALARYESREVMNRYNQAILTIILIAAIAFIVLQSYSEARQRERETALLSALGFGIRTHILLLVLKIVAIAVVAGIIGTLLGEAVALRLGPAFAKAKIATDPELMKWNIIGALVVVFISYIPAMIKTVRTDPFEILREE